MTAISPQKILYIKLGEGGIFEKDCIEKDQTLRLSYGGVDHSLCTNGKWDEVRNYFITVEKVTPGVATSHTNQVKQFYEEGDQTLWLTFYSNKLWWCFSHSKISLLPDKTKTRPVIGTWSDRDINGKLLTADNISGKLLKTQGYRGTICVVSEKKYALAKINGEQLPEVAEVETALNALKVRLSILIQHLQWKDFETLVDLIFRQAGWQRVGATGKTQKTLDLDLLAPVTGEKAIVQIKSDSNVREFQFYQEEFAKMTDYDKFFYVVHSPEMDLLKFDNTSDTLLYFVDKIAEMTISSGLVEWVIKKVS
jgi:hypothetical protein